MVLASYELADLPMFDPGALRQMLESKNSFARKKALAGHRKISESTLPVASLQNLGSA
jgi:hypothetical protein